MNKLPNSFLAGFKAGRLATIKEERNKIIKLKLKHEKIYDKYNKQFDEAEDRSEKKYASHCRQKEFYILDFIRFELLGAGK